MRYLETIVDRHYYLDNDGLQLLPYSCFRIAACSSHEDVLIMFYSHRTVVYNILVFSRNYLVILRSGEAEAALE